MVDEEWAKTFSSMWPNWSDDRKGYVATLVQEWQGSTPTLEEKHFGALRLMTEADLAAVYKRSPGELTKVQAAIEAYKMREKRETSYVFEITPYQIEDESVAEIIRKGPDALYGDWEEAMLDRAEARGVEDFIERCKGWLESAMARKRSSASALDKG